MKFADKELVGTVTIGRRVLSRKQADGSIRETTTKTFTAEFRDPTSGKRVQKSLGTKIKREAIRLARQLAIRLEDGVANPTPTHKQITMLELLERYANFHTTSGLAPRTLTTYGTENARLRGFVEARGIRSPLEFNEELVFAYADFIRSKRTKQGTVPSEKLVYLALTYLRQALRYGYRNHLVTSDASAGVRLRRPQPKRPPYCPTPEEMDRLLAVLAAPPFEKLYHDAMLILSMTGMRVNELVQLQWQDVLFDRGELGTLWIRRGGSREYGTKNRKTRFVPMHQEVHTLLKSLPRTSEHVLPGLKDRKLLLRVKAAAKIAGLPSSLTVHSSRHLFASVACAAGVPQATVLDWMGHHDSSILALYLRIYSESSHNNMKLLARPPNERGNH